MSATKEGYVLTATTDEKPKQIRTMDDFVHMKKYCFLILIFSEFVLINGAGHMIFMMYAGAAPKSVACQGKDFRIENVCELDWRSLKNCTIDIDYDFKSVNVEFGYVCERTAVVKSSISIQMLGVLFGTLFFGSLSDRMGRKKVLAFSFTMTSVLSVLGCFVTSLTMFTVSRTILGIFVGGVIGTYGVYKMEHVPKQHRFWVATIIAWAPNFIIINALAYLAKDWRTFQFIIFVCSAPAFGLFFFIHESPRWLVQRGRIDEAREIMQKIQQMDGECDLNKEDMEQLLDDEFERQKEREGKLKNYNIRHLFYTKKMVFATMVLCIGVFFTSMINYGLTFNIEKLSGSLFLNAVIMGFLRWAINIVTGIMDYKCKCVGRKAVHFLSQASIALSLITVTVIMCLGWKDEYPMVIRVATIIATATTSQVFITKSILAMEYYPTVIRNSAMAFKSTCSRIGTILSPQLFIMASNDVIPFILLSAMALYDTVSFQLVLPETKGVSLPEHLPKRMKRDKSSGNMLVRLESAPE